MTVCFSFLRQNLNLGHQCMGSDSLRFFLLRSLLHPTSLRYCIHLFLFRAQSLKKITKDRWVCWGEGSSEKIHREVQMNVNTFEPRYLEFSRETKKV